MAYQKDRNYQEEINLAVSKGDYASASRLEKERNEKIDGEGLSYAKTNKYVIPNGVSDDTYNRMNSVHKQSDDSKNRDKTVDDAYANFNSVVGNGDIVSQGVKNTINSQFQIPSAVTEADAYLSEQLKKIQSGKTSYSDQVREMMDKIMNREKFSYDVDTDPLFQQALASAMNSGKQAMQDTIGQASALTGGYGSTYATTAGNQAYNSFIEDAYDNLPQYYQMAMEAYQMEGDEMYRQYGMLSTEDDKEYNRNIMAYDATYQHRNRMYDEAYGRFRDSKSDAFAMADLQLAEHGQKVSDAYNLYNASASYAESLYAREYQEWADGVNQAMQMAGMQNSDWWNQANQDFTASENQKNRDFNAAEAEKERAFTASENAKNRAASASRSGVVGKGGYGDIPSNIASKAKSIENDGELAEYLDGLVDAGYITEEQSDYLYASNKAPEQLPLTERTWTMTNNGGNNLFWGIDGNGMAKDQYGNEMSMDDIYNELKKTMGAKEAKEWVKKLQNDIGITNYEW